MTTLATPKGKPGTYEREDAELTLTVLFNGGTPWRSETAPDADMPTADGNPARGNSFMASKIDVERAWFALLPAMRNPEAVYLSLGRGRTQPEIARWQGIRQQRISDDIAYDIGLLARGATRGVRK